MSGTANQFAYLEVSLNLCPPQFSCVRVSDVKVPSSEQLVTEVDRFAFPHFNIALIVSLAHPAGKRQQSILGGLGGACSPIQEILTPRECF